MLYGFYAYFSGFIDGKKESLEITDSILKESQFLQRVQSRYELQYLKKLGQASNLLEKSRNNSLQLLISLQNINKEVNLLDLAVPNDPRKREQVYSRLAKLENEQTNILKELAEADQQEEMLERELYIFYEKIKQKVVSRESAYIRGLSHSRRKYISLQKEFKMPEVSIMNSMVKAIRKQAIENAIMAKEGDVQHVSP